jgi:hypothetical protein
MCVFGKKSEFIAIGKPLFRFAFAALKSRDCHEPGPLFDDEISAVIALESEIYVPQFG